MPHPIRVRNVAGGTSRRRGGFWPMLAASALGGILPSIIERVLPPAGRGMKMRRMPIKGGLAAPYGGRKSKRRGGIAFTPGPLA